MRHSHLRRGVNLELMSYLIESLFRSRALQLTFKVEKRQAYDIPMVQPAPESFA